MAVTAEHRASIDAVDAVDAAEPGLKAVAEYRWLQHQLAHEALDERIRTLEAHLAALHARLDTHLGAHESRRETAAYVSAPRD